MKYCQKCKVMLKDEVEICPVCGTAQIPAEEFKAKEQKKKKTVKTVIMVCAAVAVVILLAFAVVMILGKPARAVVTNEEYTEEVTDSELQVQFAAYAVTALPQIWEGSVEESDEAIEYYKTDFPDVAAGFEQLKELQPIAGDVKSVTFDGAAKSEEGAYRLTGDMICTDGKVKYEIILGPSGYVDSLSLVLKEEPFLVRAREAVLDTMSKVE